MTYRPFSLKLTSYRGIKLIIFYGVIILFVFLFTVDSSNGARIKDISVIKGIRTNQVTGYGLVVGLNGTGDKSGADFTNQALANMMERMGIHVDKNQLKVKNVAGVMITADIPPFSKIGNKIDVVVSSIGDARSLLGGTLLLSPLKGVNGKVYALAQGPVMIGGIQTGGNRFARQRNHLQVARIANGATVEQEIPVKLNGKKSLILSLLNPDFTTAKRMADTINAFIKNGIAQVIDSSSLHLNIPPDMIDNNVAEFIADIETLIVVPDIKAKIVINEKTGTVVMGENVIIDTVAVSHGNLTVTIERVADVSQPEGQDDINTEDEVEIEELKVLPVNRNSTIGDLVNGLNSIGVSSKDLIGIIQSIKAVGALQAELQII